METVGQALAWARERLVEQSDTALVDARLLLTYLLRADHAALVAHPERPLTGPETAAYHDLVLRAAAGEPVPYLIGHWPFGTLDLIVTPDVLIPRPETEHLVDAALGWAREVALRIVDVGTGSGAIAIALAEHLPLAQFWALDSSEAALAIARRNAQRYDLLSRIAFFAGDLLTPLIERGLTVDVIAANLPYIASGDLAGLAVARHEPRAALDGGLDGLNLIGRLLDQAPGVLAQPGLLLLEIGAGQGQRVAALARQAFPGARVGILKDYAGHDRVVRLEREG